MSRSKKQSPVKGVSTASSDKADKVASHRKHRRVVKQLVSSGPVEIVPLERELTNSYVLSKDGKVRFNPQEQPKLLRK